VRQLLVESAMLALAGAAVGLFLANLCIQFLATGLPEYLSAANSRVATLSIDTTALGFTFALTLVTTIFFGLAPALQLSRVNLNEALKAGGRTIGLRSRLGSALVIAEVALAMVLLVGAGLMTRSLWRLTHVNLGYEPAAVLTAKIDPSGARYKEFAGVTAFYQELLERIRAIPGVRHASVINSLNASNKFSIDEHPPVPPDQQPIANMNQVSADYFASMGIPLRAGRFFSDRDAASAQPVVIIDESLARSYFPEEDPIGKHINMWNKSREIVGVVGGIKIWTLDRDAIPHIYFSYLQENWWSMSLVVRAQSGDPMKTAPDIRNVLAAIDTNQPIHSFKPLEATVSELVAPQRFTTTLLAGFAMLAALLAAIGIYGVMSYSVTQRTREIGVRMALGAQPGNVMRIVMKRGMILAGAGVLIGLFGAYALTGLITKMLFGVEPTDPATLAAITVLLVAVALVACLIPARRATRVDPIKALRIE
jgi:putative ABC transport system permease protein